MSCFWSDQKGQTASILAGSLWVQLVHSDWSSLEEVYQDDLASVFFTGYVMVGHVRRCILVPVTPPVSPLVC